MLLISKAIYQFGYDNSYTNAKVLFTEEKKSVIKFEWNWASDENSQ